MFVYQPTLNPIKITSMSTEYVISLKSKGVYNSKLIALNSNFLLNMKYFEKMGLKLNNKKCKCSHCRSWIIGQKFRL